MFKQQLDEKKERAVNLKDRRAKRVDESFQRKKDNAEVLSEARNMFNRPKAPPPLPPANLSHQTSLLKDIGSAFGLLSNSFKGSFKGSFKSANSCESLDKEAPTPTPMPRNKARAAAPSRKREAEEENASLPTNEAALLFSSFFFDAATELRVEKIRQEGRARRPRTNLATVDAPDDSSRSLHSASQGSLNRSNSMRTGALPASTSNASLGSLRPPSRSPSGPTRSGSGPSRYSDNDDMNGSHPDPPRLELTVPVQSSNPPMPSSTTTVRIKPMPMLQEEIESPAPSNMKPPVDLSLLKTLVMAA